jgi:DNA-binding response OmpR family regulator
MLFSLPLDDRDGPETFHSHSLNSHEGAGSEHRISILFVDDEPDAYNLAATILKAANIRVVFAENGLVALQKWLQDNYHLVVMDIVMPGLDGIETCRRLRRISDVPVILLTALDREQDVIDGLQAGADDYIIKPFRANEFLARIQAALRRSKWTNGAPVHLVGSGVIELDPASHQAFFKGKPIPVTPLEYRLLSYMMQNAGRALTKEDLLQNVWGYAEPAGELNLIETAIRRLRQKVEPDPSQPRYIQTVWGSGYRFEA